MQQEFNGFSPFLHFLLLVPVVLECQNQGCPVEETINIANIFNVKKSYMPRITNFSIINLFSFVSLLPFKSLGSCGPNWTNIPLLKT